MDMTRIRALYDKHERREAQAPGFWLETGPRTVRQLSDSGRGDMVLWSDLDETCADGAIEGELAFFRGRGRPFEWKYFSHDRPPDLRDRLAARGFEIGEDEAVMVLELSEWRARPDPGQGVEVRRITDPEGLADMVPVLRAVWDEDPTEDVAEFAGILRDNPGFMSVYIAFVDGRPVSCSRANFPSSSPFASLWGGSTLEAYRGRGIYSALLEARVGEAIGRGYAYMTIDALPTSRPIVEKRGFRLLSMSNPCSFDGGAS